MEILLLLAPALVGLAALVGGVFLVVKREGEEKLGVGRAVAGIFCLLLAFGVGTCYAVVFLGGAFR